MRKQFARADQAKEHIKEFGHYGPHSSCNRKRRCGDELKENLKIRAFYERWTMKENFQTCRDLETVEFESPPTKLWYPDDTAELYLRNNESLFAIEAHGCDVKNCYYQFGTTGDVGVTVFKSLQGLQEHRRRGHNFQTEPLKCESTDNNFSTSNLVPMEFPFEDELDFLSEYCLLENLSPPISTENEGWSDLIHKDEAPSEPAPVTSEMNQRPSSNTNPCEWVISRESHPADPEDEMTFDGTANNSATSLDGPVSITSSKE